MPGSMCSDHAGILRMFLYSMTIYAAVLDVRLTTRSGMVDETNSVTFLESSDILSDLDYHSAWLMTGNLRDGVPLVHFVPQAHRNVSVA